MLAHEKAKKGNEFLRVSKFRIPPYTKARKVSSWEDLVRYGDQALTNTN